MHVIKHRIGAGLLALGLALAALPGSALAWQGQVNGGGANLRYGVWDSVLSTLPGGSRIEVIGDAYDGEGSVWHRVRTADGSIGWVHGGLVNRSAASASEPAATGTATWYGPGFHGNLTANGEVYNMYDPNIAAANIYPLGTWLRVTNLNNGLSVEVRVTDTGGFDKINPTTVVDLSYAAFNEIADTDDGRIPVQVERL